MACFLTFIHTFTLKKFCDRFFGAGEMLSSVSRGGLFCTFAVVMKQRTYIAIDLKSFYASVECVERGLDPLAVNLVVADESRTEKTICLAVSPSLKAYGIGGRARLFEVVQRVREVNNARRKQIPQGRFTGKSYLDKELKAQIMQTYARH